jgi:membrane protease YdiL (CAAX protease family)
MEPSADTAIERYPFWNYGDLALFIGLALPCLLAGAVVVRIVTVVLGILPRSKALELLPAQFLGYAFLFCVLYLIFRLQYRRPFWRSLGWIRSGPRVPALIAMGLALALAVGLLGALLRTPDIDSPLKQLFSDRTSIVVMAVFAITLGPLCEELFFRGFMQPLLVRSLGVVAGIVLTALPFGLLHLQEYAYSWRHVLLISVAGAAFGWIRHRTGSTRAAVIMHAAYNSAFFIGLLSQGKGVPHTW